MRKPATKRDQPSIARIMFIAFGVVVAAFIVAMFVFGSQHVG